MTNTLSLSWPSERIGLLTWDMPDKGANVLSNSVLDELASHLDSLESRDAVDGLVMISGKPGMFIAGADLREFAQGMDGDKATAVALCQRGQSLFRRLAAMPFVTIAAIDGICVGGGAEMSIWCDRRILSTNSRTGFGFPEVKLGLFPGWGGTVRLPRVIGLSNAVEMITGGENASGQDAWTMGLCDDLVEPGQLLDAAVRMATAEAASGRYRGDRERWAKPIAVSENELGFLAASASAMIMGQTKGQYPAPMAALEVLLEGCLESEEDAALREAEGFADLFGTEVNQALLNLFFLTDHNKKDAGVGDGQPKRNDKTSKPDLPKLRSVGVVGAGIMGAGIVAANLKRGVRTVLADVSVDALQSGATQATGDAAYDKALKGPSAKKAMEAGALLNLGLPQDTGNCDIVIEAIVENPEIKQTVLAELEERMSPESVLGSNTSTIPITKLSTVLKRPDRFCGIHFFNPVRRMKLVEIIRGEATSDETVAIAVSYAKRIGKMPIVVGDGPGFLVNRLLFPYMNESLQLLTEGVPMKDIERAATRFGMPMGPLALYDMVGLDTALYAGRVMWEAFPERVQALPIVPALVKQGRLGQKSGSGFFNYQNRKGKPEPDPESNRLLADYMGEPAKVDPQVLAYRLFAPMVLEATRVLEAKLVRDVRDVDLGMIFGLGFPAFRGGLLHWADTLGAEQLVEQLKPFEAIGDRFKPTPLLLEMAAENRSFYPR